MPLRSCSRKGACAHNAAPIMLAKKLHDAQTETAIKRRRGAFARRRGKSDIAEEFGGDECKSIFISALPSLPKPSFACFVRMASSLFFASGRNLRDCFPLSDFWVCQRQFVLRLAEKFNEREFADGFLRQGTPLLQMEKNLRFVSLSETRRDNANRNFGIGIATAAIGRRAAAFIEQSPIFPCFDRLGASECEQCRRHPRISRSLRHFADASKRLIISSLLRFSCGLFSSDSSHAGGGDWEFMGEIYASDPTTKTRFCKSSQCLARCAYLAKSKTPVSS